MAGKQAKILNPERHLPRLLELCDENRYPHRDKVIVLLSVKAGLRRMEIANLRRHHVMDASGEVGQVIDLQDRICKMGSGRIVPIHRELRSALVDLFAKVPGRPEHPLILSERALRDDGSGEGTGALYCMTAESIGLFFWRLYKKAGLVGCSSHSGRRTFGTTAAKKVQAAGGALRDVQALLGHKNLGTTQRYIDTDTDAQRRLIESL